MPKRVQSPSSINVYKQCPRRYYYQYIKKLPTFPNIHTVRGNIVHSVLEKFFELNPATLDSLNYQQELANYLSNLFDALWKKNSKSLSEVCKDDKQNNDFYEESRMMLGNWLNVFFNKLNHKMKEMDFVSAFNSLKPLSVEQEFRSEKHMVRGFIDVIESENDIIKVVDYKTSKPKDTISNEYKLQLSIYALLYKEIHGKLPDKASIWFLKDREVIIDVDDSMLLNAEFEIEQIHFATESSLICDYPLKTSPLCKWSNGQCDFYEQCMKDRQDH